MYGTGIYRASRCLYRNSRKPCSHNKRKQDSQDSGRKLFYKFSYFHIPSFLLQHTIIRLVLYNSLIKKEQPTLSLAKLVQTTYLFIYHSFIELSIFPREFLPDFSAPQRIPSMYKGKFLQQKNCRIKHTSGITCINILKFV